MPFRDVQRGKVNVRWAGKVLSETNAPDIRRMILSSCDAVGQALLIDGLYNSQGLTNLQSIDNSLICSFLFPQNEVGRRSITDKPDADVAFIGSEIFRLLIKFHKTAGFKPVVSLPTLFEMGNSFINLSQKFSSSSGHIYKDSSLYDRVMRLLDPSDHDEYGDLSSDYLGKAAHELYDLLPAALRTDNLDEYMTLIKEKAISGLGEYYETELYKRLKPRLIGLTNRVSAFLDRYRDKKGSENEGSFNFRNRIDAVNLAIPYVFQREANNVHIGFATPFPANLDRQVNSFRDSEVRGILRSRTLPLTLYFLLRSQEITENNSSDHPEATHWLQALASRSEVCKSYINQSEDTSQLSDTWKREIYLLFEDFMNPLYAKKERREPDSEIIRKARELFTSREAFRDQFRQASQNVDNAAKQFMSIKTVITSEELMSDLGFLDDPRVKQIRARYNLG